MTRPKLICLLVLIVSGPNCATTERAGRTTVTLSGGASYPRHRTAGCAGSSGTLQRHEVIGGTAQARVEAADGFNVGGDLSIAHGKLIEANFTPERGDYTLGSFGLMLGGEGRYVGVDLGGAMFFTVGSDHPTLVVPRVRLRVGALDTTWAEATIGPIGGLFDGRLAAVGIAGRRARFGGSLGLAFVTQPLLDANGSTILLGTDPDGPYPSAYLTVGVGIDNGFSVVGTAILGDSSSFTAGLSYDMLHEP